MLYKAAQSAGGFLSHPTSADPAQKPLLEAGTSRFPYGRDKNMRQEIYPGSRSGAAMLYAFGSNGSGQLGLGEDHEDHPLPQVAAKFTKGTKDIKQIAAGGNHTLFLYADSTVIAVGCNDDGQCLRYPALKECDFGEPKMDPIGPSFLRGVVQASATWSASFLLTSHGSVGTCGSGNCGELGLGPGIQRAGMLQQIPSFPSRGLHVTHLASSMGHTVAVLSSGEVYGWGKGRKGQLGMPYDHAWSPRKIDGIPFPVVKAVCGKDFTCVIGLHETGEVMVFGLDTHDRFDVIGGAPGAVPGWKDIAASWGSIHVLKEDGEIVSWGRNDHGQLAPQGLPPIEAIAAGSEHCLALTKAGEVLAWGWGEHGNCGEPTDDCGDVKGRWNVISISQPVSAVFAGCATGFVVTDCAG